MRLLHVMRRLTFSCVDTCVKLMTHKRIKQEDGVDWPLLTLFIILRTMRDCDHLFCMMKVRRFKSQCSEPACNVAYVRNLFEFNYVHYICHMLTCVNTLTVNRMWVGHTDTHETVKGTLLVKNNPNTHELCYKSISLCDTSLIYSVKYSVDQINSS